MGADREPGATTTYRTPPSSSDATAIRAQATDVSAGSGLAEVLEPADCWAGCEVPAGPAVAPMVCAEGSVGSCEVTEPVCHQRRSLTSCGLNANPLSAPA